MNSTRPLLAYAGGGKNKIYTYVNTTGAGSILFFIPLVETPKYILEFVN